ncbi:class I SAM-dependent methyltransferase [Actinomycetospora flava]|uniref:Methyltransferase domain-containing protein n=1 Tax=Actinomycetospora flava TaxID=3129232 RepID=A0ABU8M531_9PSEU
MAESGAGTYEEILQDLLDRRVLDRDHSVLVQFAGEFDRGVTVRLGLRDVTFVNLEPASVSSRLPSALRADAHRMTAEDGSYDHVIGHAGLHHCSRPHQALYEMYRIARRTVVAVENQDSPLMRVAGRFGLVGSYEHDAVADGGGTTGGVDGTGVPNHVYRWTRREVEKTIASFDPGRTVPVEFRSRWLIGTDRALTPGMRSVLGGGGAPARARLVKGLNLGLNGVARRQGNIFGFTIRKDLSRPQTWIPVEPTVTVAEVPA